MIDITDELVARVAEQVRGINDLHGSEDIVRHTLSIANRLTTDDVPDTEEKRQHYVDLAEENLRTAYQTTGNALLYATMGLGYATLAVAVRP